MAAYQFQTVWRFEAPIAAVWDALADLEGAAWWPGLAVTVLVRGDRRGVGDVLRYDLRTQLPYTLSFIAIVTALERPHRIALQVGGDLVGTGCWAVEQDGRVTRATYLWTVRTTKRWMNLLAPALRLAFAWNHHRVMSAGARGLAQHLAVRLVEATATVSGR